VEREVARLLHRAHFGEKGENPPIAVHCPNDQNAGKMAVAVILDELARGDLDASEKVTRRASFAILRRARPATEEY